MLSFAFCRCYTFRLPLAYCFPLLLRYGGQYFYKDVIHHIKHPFLPCWIVCKGCRQIQNFKAYAVFFEVLQLVLYICFVTAQTVKGFNHKRITTAQHSRFKGCISASVQILAAFFIRDNVSL